MQITRLIVSGGRDFNDYEGMVYCLNQIVPLYDNVVIVNGDASGADYLSSKYSREVLGKEPELYPADWDGKGDPAGPLRNTEMANVGHVLVSFWDLNSMGTHDMIKKGEKYGLDVYVFAYERHEKETPAYSVQKEWTCTVQRQPIRKPRIRDSSTESNQVWKQVRHPLLR